MTDPNQHIFYETWKDRGGNIGVQCTVCLTTFWTGNEPVGKVFIDPQHIERGQKDCENCKAIKENGVLQKENEAHKAEEECLHKPSQP